MALYLYFGEAEAMALRSGKRHLAIGMAAILTVIGMLPCLAAASVRAEGVTDADSRPSEEGAAGTAGEAGTAYSDVSYASYAPAFAQWPSAREEISLAAEKAVLSGQGAALVQNVHAGGKAGVVIEDAGYVDWSFQVPADAVYEIVITYMAGSTGNGDMEIGLLLDNRVLFREMTLLSLKREYRQDAVFETDMAGNHIQPEVTEQFQWRDAVLRQTAGLSASAYRFALAAGSHTLRLSGSRGSVAVAGVQLRPLTKTPSYEAYISGLRETPDGAAELEEPLVAEGEAYSSKTDLTILPATDRVSPSTYPQSSHALLLNTIGGDNWKNQGETITWTVDIPADGFYRIAPRFLQNVQDGIFSSRSLTIDGKSPFAEAESLRFGYATAWQLAPLGGDAPYRFYMKKGRHEIGLTVTMGDVADMVKAVENAVTVLNEQYRKIIMITGASPDIYRDYRFEATIPDVFDEFEKQRAVLQGVVDRIDKETGADSSYTSIIKKVVFQLEKMTGSPRELAKYLENFKTNMGALGTWILTASQQPLAIDRLFIVPSGAAMPVESDSFFADLWFNLKCFLSTFFTDYASIGQRFPSDSGQQLKVWAQTGRDQANILRQLVDTDFTLDHDMAVTLELVTADTLLQSILAGRGPDVALDNGSTVPINYAVRNACVDMALFADFQEVASWFPDSALVPYTYRGHTYALPQSYSFPMFFYRTDIFRELRLTPPKTWKQVYALIADLQRKHLELGLPAGLAGYAMLLYQNGGNFYIDEGAASDLSSNVAVSTFVEFTELFTLYDQPVSYDFANRFRSGEMPCGIQDYSMYNQLTVFAPEIRGMWEMVPVPGRELADGSIDNTAIGGGSNVILFDQRGKKEMGWEFIKWLLAADTQSAFGRRMESILGSGAKYATANKEALAQMTWSSREYQNLAAQMEHVRSIPEVPGGYELPRSVTFAFNRVYNGSQEQSMAENPVEVLAEYTQDLNRELKRKRAEFQLTNG